MTAAAIPAGVRRADGVCENLPGDVSNRVGAFFAGLLNKHRAAESVPAGATD